MRTPTRQTSPYCSYGSRSDHADGSIDCPDENCVYKAPSPKRPPPGKQKTRRQLAEEGAKEIVKVIDSATRPLNR